MSWMQETDSFILEKTFRVWLETMNKDSIVEWLICYGWAVLVVLVAVYALLYFFLTGELKWRWSK